MANEDADQERQRVLNIANEDLKKEVPALLADIHRAAIRGLSTEGSPSTMTLYRHAALLAVLSNQAEKQTRRIVRLTWVLIALTAALLLFTVYLSYDAYLHDQRVKQQGKDRTEESKSDVDIH